MDKHYRRALVLSFVLFWVCAYATTQQRREELQRTWEGCNVNDLITKLGPPTQIMDDGQGGKIYVYTTTKTSHSGADSFTTYQGQRQGDYYQASKGFVQGSSYAGQAYTFSGQSASFTSSRHQMFWVNDHGIIYRVEYQKTKGR
jgi:hypothetical protein